MRHQLLCCLAMQKTGVQLQHLCLVDRRHIPCMLRVGDDDCLLSHRYTFPTNRSLQHGLEKTMAKGERCSKSSQNKNHNNHHTKIPSKCDILWDFAFKQENKVDLSIDLSPFQPGQKPWLKSVWGVVSGAKKNCLGYIIMLAPNVRPPIFCYGCSRQNIKLATATTGNKIFCFVFAYSVGFNG